MGRQQRSVEVLIQNRSWQQWALGEGKAEKGLVIPDVHPPNVGRQINISEQAVVADVEEDLVAGLHLNQSATDDAGSGPADVSQRHEARAS